MEEPRVEGQEPEVAEPRRFQLRLGFPWGLAAGVLLTLLVVLTWYAVLQYTAASAFRGGGLSGRSDITVTPVEAGKHWFAIDRDGRGRMTAWFGGGRSSGSGDGQPAGSIGSIDIGAVGVVDGVRVKHTLELYVTHDTKVFVGSQPYRSGLIGGGDSTLQERPLTIQFHRSGAALVADRIDAPLEASPNPLQY